LLLGFIPPLKFFHDKDHHQSSLLLLPLLPPLAEFILWALNLLKHLELLLGQ